MRLFVLFFALLMGILMPSARAEQASVVGFWSVEGGEAVVEIYPCEEGEYCGRFYWLKENSAEKPSLDDNNPDPEKSKRPLCGLQFLGGFTDEGAGDFGNGWVYSARHGSMFSAHLRLVDSGTLEMRGYMFLPFLGQSQKWRRVEPAQACTNLSSSQKI